MHRLMPDVKMCINCRSSTFHKEKLEHITREFYYCDVHKIAIPYNWICEYWSHDILFDDNKPVSK